MMLFNKNKFKAAKLLASFLLILVPSTVYSSSQVIFVGVPPVKHNEKARISVNQDMRFPTVYDTFSGALTSEEKSKIAIGGSDGLNALISVTGISSGSYELNFSDAVVCNTNDALACLTITIAISQSSGGNKTGRHLDTNGNDLVTIVGAATVPAEMTSGTYSNSATPLAVTATYESSE